MTGSVSVGAPSLAASDFFAGRLRERLRDLG